MLGLMGFSGSLPLCVTIVDIICMFINWANKDACLLVRDGWLERGSCKTLLPLWRASHNHNHKHICKAP